jgi:twitching motility protein PilI
MAKNKPKDKPRNKISLQAYQQDILDRLKNLAEGGTTAPSSRLGVKIGGSNWLVSLDDISEVLPIPDIMQVPLTHSWFIGMANVRGSLYGLTDLAGLLGNSPGTVTDQSRILLVHQRLDVNAGFLVDQLVGLRNLEDMQMQSPQPEKPEWQLGQYQDASGQSWDELDIEALISQDDFMRVAA